ncbi:DegV family protein [Anaerocolumna sp. AGMB13025]|uniref:DegV family protein n=1 Tax=Anaerocolumna sp. AGMB13025 TaxID=3039116 RepID=UPI00241DD493|nr:DegV family protein [Anaerocolumna sp. AGMB13025]WFR59376.1 DegV family protein [Anaerocolumna sp. AGMB13025]
MIKIIVDSTCDLPEEDIKKYDISVLPLKVLLEDKEYLDKKTITVDEVYGAMRKGIMPKTSQPSPETIYNLFSEYAVAGWEFIYLSFSQALSGTYQLANSVLGEVKEKYPEVNMEVVDSKGGSTATGLIALQAARMAFGGNLEFKRISDYVKELINCVEHIFTIPDLSWLIKGGRIGRTQGMIGNILNINPILDVKNGEMEVIHKVRGRKKALNTVVDLLEERAKSLTNQIIGISHADDPEIAEALMELIKSRLGCTRFIVNKIGSVLGSHLGIGGVGIFFFNEDAKDVIKNT